MCTYFRKKRALHLGKSQARREEGIEDALRRLVVVANAKIQEYVDDEKTCDLETVAFFRS